MEREYRFSTVDGKREKAVIVTLQNANYSGDEKVRYLKFPERGC